MITTTQYAAKYGVTRNTASDRAKRGAIAAQMIGGKWYVADEPVETPKKGGGFRGNQKFCGGCGMWKGLTLYSASRRERTGGLCKPCNAHGQRVRQGDGNSPESLSYKQEVKAQVELRDMRAMRLLGERNARIKAHAARIEAMGLCGDGEDWPNGE